MAKCSYRGKHGRCNDSAAFYCSVCGKAFCSSHINFRRVECKFLWHYYTRDIMVCSECNIKRN